MAGWCSSFCSSEEGKGPGRSFLTSEVIPGISALNASASRLGAPLMHDFACISLSDRLTPWDVIEKRLDAAAAADFVIVLYNPRSKGRAGHINRAREIILKHRGPATVVGIVKGAMREHETVIVTDLENMQDSDIDMQTTVIIGNSKTFVWNNLMITPRGYENKFAHLTYRIAKPSASSLLWDESFLWGVMAYKALEENGLSFDLHPLRRREESAG